jgi:hypothetical protein
MMGNPASKRASRLRRYKDAADEYRETGSKKAKEEMFKGMREGTERDFVAASENQVGSIVDDKARRMKLMRDVGIGPFERQKEEKG